SGHQSVETEEIVAVGATCHAVSQVANLLPLLLRDFDRRVSAHIYLPSAAHLATMAHRQSRRASSARSRAISASASSLAAFSFSPSASPFPLRASPFSLAVGNSAPPHAPPASRNRCPFPSPTTRIQHPSTFDRTRSSFVASTRTNPRRATLRYT